MSAASHFWSSGPLGSGIDSMVIVGLVLTAAGALALAWLWLRDARADDTARDEREADHAATAALDPATSPEHLARTATAALTPDALPDAVPVVPGPPAEPGPVIADAIEHLASAIVATRLDLGDDIATQWRARAYRELHRLDADQLRELLVVELDAAATCRADELLHPTPTTPQES
ncbi:hypothetical protein EDC02_5908 [Micromonospora sp. Llam0]|uniref:hypothetical protein n=1 Tax=Micromonospora sp. Llam0 TaxID=2485143 RepID=UPI000F47BFCB|nr:hypothetical protein [Micromonospora sp. Llam0]ROO51044.1 hypothetical protein EDC02_5908 [Micromonospora sp. Llam0]